MKYTKEQLDEMSDYEIDIAVANKDKIPENALNSIKSRAWSYLGDWNNVMPIAEKYGIDVCFSGALGKISTTYCLDLPVDNRCESDNKNPRRAICEVFLMMEI